MTINKQLVEARWKALGTWQSPQRPLFEDKTLNSHEAQEIERVVTIFSSKDRQYSRAGISSGEHFTPKLIADFVAKFTQRHQPNSILDPTCGLGYLLATAASACNAEDIQGIEINTEVAGKASTIWSEDLNIITSEALHSLGETDKRYDMIVSDPPLNVRLRDEQIQALSSKIKTRDFSTALILTCLERLEPNGIGIFVVPPSFLLDRNKEQFLQNLQQCGFRISACIQVPSGTRFNTTISTYLIIIQAGEQEKTLIGQAKDDDDHLHQLVCNFYRNKPKGNISTGRLCDFNYFQSYDSYVAKEQLERLAKKLHWTAHSGSELITEFESIRRRRAKNTGTLKEDSTSIFLKLIGKPQASRQSEDLGEAQEVGHIKVNAEIAEPEFLEHWINAYQVGKLTFDSIRSGETIPRTKLNDLVKATFFLPSKEMQKTACQAWSYLQKVRSEADELESRLCNWEDDPKELLSNIKTINQEDRHEDWIDSLPFPLASILWRHHASKDSYRDRYQMLLQFFEATAAFLATVHLSAYLSSDRQWEKVGQDLCSKLSSQGLSLERATFGSWKLVVERLASACSSSLKAAAGDADQLSMIEEMYCTSDRQVLAMLSNKKLLHVLQAANKIRNDNHGHAGAIGEEAAARIHDELIDLVYQIKAVFGRHWNRYQLIQPGSMSYRAGIHHIQCKRVMGTRSAPFEEVVHESNMPLETDALYLFDSIRRTGLKLQPFVEVIPSPERQAVACFIFNRVDKDQTRWISYHFDKESEISHSTHEVLATLSKIGGFGSNEQTTASM